MPNQVYAGPIIFIVHSVLNGANNTYENKLLHFKKLLKVIRFANKHSLPIVFGLGKSTLELMQYASVFEDTRKTLDEEFKLFIQLLKEVKTRLELVELDPLNPNSWEKKIETSFKFADIKPTKVIVCGWYKEICEQRALIALRLLYPSTELIELRGDYSFSYIRRNPSDITGNTLKETNKKIKANFRIKRSVLARKILRP